MCVCACVCAHAHVCVCLRERSGTARLGSVSEKGSVGSVAVTTIGQEEGEYFRCAHMCPQARAHERAHTRASTTHARTNVSGEGDLLAREIGGDTADVQGMHVVRAYVRVCACVHSRVRV